MLELGCGPGAYSEELVSRGALVDACDMSERMLEHARERLAEHVALEQVTLHHLDFTQSLGRFSDATFQLVLAPLCLDYVEDWQALFEQCHRLLEPSGHLVFSCGHPSFDAEYFETESYFEVEAVECTWTGFGIDVVMPSYRRPLAVVFQSVIDAGFSIETVHEPLPTEAFRKADPKRHKRLLHQPCFLCIRGRKDGSLDA